MYLDVGSLCYLVSAQISGKIRIGRFKGLPSGLKNPQAARINGIFLGQFKYYAAYVKDRSGDGRAGRTDQVIGGFGQNKL